MTTNRGARQGRRPVPSRKICERAYAGALGEPCGQCKAAAGEYCTRTDDYGGVHVRRIPCLHRIQPSLVAIDDQGPVPAVDFAEPRHARNDDQGT